MPRNLEIDHAVELPRAQESKTTQNPRKRTQIETGLVVGSLKVSCGATSRLQDAGEIQLSGHPGTRNRGRALATRLDTRPVGNYRFLVIGLMADLRSLAGTLNVRPPLCGLLHLNNIALLHLNNIALLSPSTGCFKNRVLMA
jgi:hypothetical protein